MVDTSPHEYPELDTEQVSRSLFYPRTETAAQESGGSERLSIPVEGALAIGARFHCSRTDRPTILFFHGNGEIASDYEDIGPLYAAKGINFLPVDYRGYGLSSGSPSFSTMMRDGRTVAAFVHRWLTERGVTGPLIVMGRSLGSAPALEVASRNSPEIAGLIIESGFAHILPLLELFGISGRELTEASGPQNLQKIRRIGIPTLIIHAERDRIIPLSEGKELYAASGAARKEFLMIPGADHNTIFARGMRQYLDAIGSFLEGPFGPQP